jgi:hypothetical protein
MTNPKWNEEAMEKAITRALDERRATAIPENFAARVCGSLPAPPVMRRRTSVGRTIAMVMVVLAMSAMFAMAPRATVNFANLGFDVECLLMLQLAGIMYWLAGKGAGSRE